VAEGGRDLMAKPVSRFLVVPDSFKGTLGAGEVAEAVGRGLEEAGAEADLCPGADGGEGTVEVLIGERGGERRPARAHDPLGREIEVSFALLERGGPGGGVTAAVEVAAASGLGLVGSAERDAEAASSAGTGELITAAVAAGANRILVAAGGSATTDGGRGAIEAIRSAGGLADVRLEVLCDTRVPFERAADVFAPQKGADDEAVARLGDRLKALAGALPRDPRGHPMTGAAGGLAGGLWAAFGARLVPGAAYVLGVLGFDRRLEQADAVITGEGRLDEQSAEGKLVGEVARRARAAGVAVHAIVGADALSPTGSRLGLASVSTAADREAIAAAANAIASAGGDPVA
jgi:glycerate kinase